MITERKNSAENQRRASNDLKPGILRYVSLFYPRGITPESYVSMTRCHYEDAKEAFDKLREEGRLIEIDGRFSYPSHAGVQLPPNIQQNSALAPVAIRSSKIGGEDVQKRILEYLSQNANGVTRRECADLLRLTYNQVYDAFCVLLARHQVKEFRRQFFHPTTQPPAYVRQPRAKKRKENGPAASTVHDEVPTVQNDRNERRRIPKGATYSWQVLETEKDETQGDKKSLPRTTEDKLRRALDYLHSGRLATFHDLLMLDLTHDDVSQFKNEGYITLLAVGTYKATKKGESRYEEFAKSPV